MEKVTVIGAGLAGSEAAWQLAKRGVPVDLYEMRPVKQTPAHHTDKFAELVCSNSLRANGLTNAVGVIKEEMRVLDSIIMEAADQASVPAGGALAVDRHHFSDFVTEKVKKHPLVTVYTEEVTNIPEGPTIIATGPLTSEILAEQIKSLTGEDDLYFYDAAAPIIAKESIDMEKVYLKSRYDKGEAAYLNCPMTEEEFNAFYEALITAETTELKQFEKEIFFEGCMPIEVMAKRGIKTMLFGPLKPVGLENPKTGKRPYAVLQLRQDDAAGTLYNLVGFQTHLKWGEQKRVFQMVPGLENAEIVRYGVIHRNTFINSPKVLLHTYQLKARADLFFAGQMTGVEGYVESAASGLVAGINAARYVTGEKPISFPEESAMGSMARYITSTSAKTFQPMNVNFGLFPELSEKIRAKQERNQKLAERAITAIKTLAEEL
ncbi:FADH(2)-oxidizing methylenetetrahydrofolate--tRNA-(uracil(54)-C(5))-methyltransferase TrmFO [Listeria sp. PSOL-1]|uniref:FADH(2)-oxidizing methylenetetrahydrofolate--tRNA-(uracil(54)-C(5))- methyltransferase TrmFO n=1 Tax=Listeria sp. PSOL-1 TaxID=1844999 RepID=UPI00351B8C14